MSKNTQLGNLVNGIYVDSTGNVGIGTTAPNYILDAYSTGASNARINIGGTTNFVASQYTNTSGTMYVGIDDSAGANFTGTAYGRFIYSSGAYPLIFNVNSLERMRVDSSGSVGINGAPNPDSGDTRIQINGGQYGTLNLRSTSVNASVRAHNPNGGLYVGTTSNHFAAIFTNDAERMRITSGGAVGIGTSSPSHNLSIKGSNSTDMISWTDAINNTGYLGIRGGGVVWMNADNNLVLATSNTERMRITSGGNVGIGTTTPAVKLQIDGTNDQERFRLQNTDSPSYMAFSEQNITMWRPNDSGSAFVIRTQAISGTWTGGGGGIEFRPLNTLRMTIGPTGNIGAPSGTNIYNASDARLKQNISQITYGLDAITALNPVKFNWVDGFEPSEDGKDMLGFVAQEVLEVLPEAVELFGNDIDLNGETVTTPLRVNEKFIIPVLVKAIQELKAEIDILKNK